MRVRGSKKGKNDKNQAPVFPHRRGAEEEEEMRRKKKRVLSTLLC
jgi:hypothetical protein